MKVKETTICGQTPSRLLKLKVELKNTCLEFPDFYFEYSSVKR